MPISAVKSRRAEREAEIRRQKGFVGFGAELVRFEERFSGVVGSLLGAVAVMETMDDAVRLARAFSYKLKIVTLTGEVLNPGGAITGGSQNQAHGLLSRGKEIAALKEEIDKLTKKMNKYEDEIENYSDKQNAAESEAQALLARRRQLQEEAGRQESEAALCESLLLNLQEKNRSLEKEAEEISAQLLNSRQDKAQDEKNQKAFLAAQKEQEEVLLALQQELEKMVGERNTASERVVAKTIEKNAVTKDISVYRDREAAFLQNKTPKKSLPP